MTPQAVDAVGEILLSLSYLPTAERLTVVVAKCKNLVWTNGKNTAGQGHLFVSCSVCVLCVVSVRMGAAWRVWVSVSLCMNCRKNCSSLSAFESVQIFQNHSHPTTKHDTYWLSNNRLLMSAPRRYINPHLERQMGLKWLVHHIKGDIKVTHWNSVIIIHRANCVYRTVYPVDYSLMRSLLHGVQTVRVGVDVPACVTWL